MKGVDMTGAARFLAPLLVVATAAPAQSRQSGTEQPDAQKLIHDVREHYRSAKSYNIEAVRETEFSSELSRQWDKEFFKVASAPGNRLRLEAKNAHGWMVEISDGNSQWILDQMAHLYTRTTVPKDGLPKTSSGPVSISRMGLMDAERLVSNIAGRLAQIHNPLLLSNETLALDGKKFPCWVIVGTGRYVTSSRDARPRYTFWIDQNTAVVRRETVQMHGALIVNEPELLSENEVTEYPVAELDPPALAAGVFEFAPPSDARLVAELPSPMQRSTELVGRMAPDVLLDLAGPKPVSLADFKGRPVLLELWATWCAPCVSAMPALIELYKEFSPKGLILVSVDEDEDAETAAQFWTKHKAPWMNYHDADGDIQQRLAPGGIPLFVLIDSSGKILFAESGYDEAHVRAAVARLGSDFAAATSRRRQ
jgi:thiol-disulfide isomerase/thioredoxin/outer membrane lipoprotein-sorting protein